MKRLCVVFVLLLGAIILYAQAPNWVWAYQTGGIETDRGWNVATDVQGNVYYVGNYYGSATFGSTTLSDGLTYIAKMSSDGTWLWAINASFSTASYNFGTKVDAAGNIYIAHVFYGTATFGSTTLVSSGGANIAVAKLDTNGNWLWAKKAGCNTALGMAIDAEGNSYITGTFYGSVVVGGTTLTSTANADIYVAKLDSNGNWLWAKQAGGMGFNRGNAISVDANGNSYVTGYFQSTASFGTNQIVSSGYADMFIAKLDSNGNWIWAKQVGSTGWDEGFGITTDANGNSFATGSFQHTVNFGDITLTSAGSADTYITKLDSNGNWHWVSQISGTSSSSGLGITVDASGNCYIAGSFGGTATLGSYTLTSFGEYDIYAAKLDQNGSCLWMKQAGSSDNDSAYCIAVDSMGNCYVTGMISSTANFDDISLPNTGGWDIFMAKLSSGSSSEDSFLPSASIAALGNHPNPFSTQTTICYELKEPASIKIDVYNLKGQLVNTLVNDSKSTGRHNAVWNGRDMQGKDVANGVYFYTLTTGSHSSTRKLIVMK